MIIAFVGVGQVGAPLAAHLASAGHEVRIAARNPASDSVRAALERSPLLKALPPAEALDGAEVAFLATPFTAAEPTVRELSASLAGKIVVDCTNPVGPGLTHGLGGQRSGSEVLQAAAPDARFVKAFTIYGFENFESTAYPGYGSLKPAMLLAGSDAEAKTVVSALCRVLGWEPVDTGPLSSALHLEHMTLLWIKMARAQGLGTNFVWARLSR